VTERSLCRYRRADMIPAAHQPRHHHALSCRAVLTCRLGPFSREPACFHRCVIPPSHESPKTWTRASGRQLIGRRTPFQRGKGSPRRPGWLVLIRFWEESPAPQAA
jgi:hypothetical protein